MQRLQSAEVPSTAASIAGKASARRELENSQDPKQTRTVQHFLQRQSQFSPVIPFEIRRSPELWVGDATALQSKQQSGYSAKPHAPKHAKDARS